LAGLFSISQKKCYGLQRVCRVWRIARSTIYARRLRKQPGAPALKKRGPRQMVDDVKLLEYIRHVLASSPFQGEGHRKVRAALRFGMYGINAFAVSEERVLRVMRENNLLSAARSPWKPEKKHEGKITTAVPNKMWGTDMTSTVLATGRQGHVFAVVDHCVQDCIGIHVSKSANRFQAVEPVRMAVETVFGKCEKDAAKGVDLRHDCGSAYLSSHFQNEVDFLGLRTSPALVREPECNGVVERFFRTLKEQLLWLRQFQSIEELREAVVEFVKKYNSCWMVAKHDYRAPSQVREKFILKKAA
jgi:putative transposase